MYIRAKAFFIYFYSHKKTRRRLEWSVLAALVMWVVYSFVFAAPADFPVHMLLPVKQGSTLEEVASNLKERGLVNSATLFEILARLKRTDGTVVAGEYAFNTPQNIITVASRITSGDFQIEPVKVRVTEGMSAQQIAKLLGNSVPDFDTQGFYDLAIKEEGKLYPDTYFILPGEEPALTLSAMTENFNRHIHTLPAATQIATFGRPLGDVLSMASILEREAATMQDRRIIAGILWHRLDIGMKLQVDVAPDTYKTVGLPETPIGNPSIEAIEATVTPLETSYLYYLSDSQNKVYFSTTYEQHLAKIKKYLDN